MKFIKELGGGNHLVSVVAYSIISIIDGDWNEWNYDTEEYYYEEECDNVMSYLKNSPDGDYILHWYEDGIQTDYHPDEGLLWNVYESSGASATAYHVCKGKVEEVYPWS